MKLAWHVTRLHPFDAFTPSVMPLELPTNKTCLLIRRPAFERTGLTRSVIDERLGLTDQEFRVESDLIVVGPILDDSALQQLIDDLEGRGLVYFQDFFDLSGNWPEWLVLFARESGQG
jgi:hypothetical protein